MCLVRFAAGVMVAAAVLRSRVAALVARDRCPAPASAAQLSADPNQGEDEMLCVLSGDVLLECWTLADTLSARHSAELCSSSSSGTVVADGEGGDVVAAAMRRDNMAHQSDARRAPLWSDARQEPDAIDMVDREQDGAGECGPHAEASSVAAAADEEAEDKGSDAQRHHRVLSPSTPSSATTSGSLPLVSRSAQAGRPVKTARVQDVSLLGAARAESAAVSTAEESCGVESGAALQAAVRSFLHFSPVARWRRTMPLRLRVVRGHVRPGAADVVAALRREGLRPEEQCDNDNDGEDDDDRRVAGAGAGAEVSTSLQGAETTRAHGWQRHVFAGAGVGHAGVRVEVLYTTQLSSPPGSDCVPGTGLSRLADMEVRTAQRGEGKGWGGAGGDEGSDNSKKEISGSS